MTAASRERLRAFVPFAVLAAAAAALTAWLILSARIPRGSDQAVVALMARHILEGRGHPVFYWGSAYGGTLEPHLLVPVFAVFGATPEAFRGFYVVLWGAFAAGTVALAARFFGRAAALFAAAFLAVPPFFLPYKLLTSDGAYASVALLGLLVLAFALEADARLSSGRRVGFLLAGLGFAAGLGLWVTPVTLPVPLLAAAWLAARPGVRPARSAWLACGGAFLTGALPTIVWNARHGAASLVAREMAPAAGADLLANLRGFASGAVPVLVGAKRPNFRPDSLDSFPFASVVVPLLVLALLVPAFRAARRDRRVLLLLAVLATLCAAAALSSRLVPGEPRYAVAAYAALAPLLGFSLAAAPPGGKRWMAAGFAVVLASDFAGAARARRHVVDTDDAQVTASIAPLVSELRRLGVTRAYANYWTAYRVTLESGGAVLATPILREDGSRNLEWDAAVRAAPDPAVVLLPPRDACFRAALEETREPFGADRVGAFTVFHGFAPSVRNAIAAAAALPMPSTAYRVVWSDPHVPARLAPGGTAPASIHAENPGPCTWMANVRVVATWEGPAPSERAFETPDRRVSPGDGADLAFELRAPDAPGRYRLRLDLQQAGVARFSEKGGAPWETEIDVAR